MAKRVCICNDCIRFQEYGTDCYFYYRGRLQCTDFATKRNSNLEKKVVMLDEKGNKRKRWA